MDNPKKEICGIVEKVFYANNGWASFTVQLDKRGRNKLVTYQDVIRCSGKCNVDMNSVKEGAVVFVQDYKKMAEKLGVGEPTLRDIVKEISSPGRDPREDLPPVVLRSDVLEMKDLQEGMILKGTVRNVIDFGAFVDIGVHQDGLVHISQLTKKKFVKHPLDVVSVGDIVDVKILSVDEKKKRIALSMIL